MPVSWSKPERRAWRVDRSMTVAEFAEQHRILDDSSAEPGPFRVDRTPFMREPLDAFGPGSGVSKIVLRCSTQVSKTETLMNCLSYAIAQEPGTTLFVMAREQDSKRMLEDRIKPMVQKSPRIRQEMSPSKHDWKVSGEVKFRRMRLYMGWANSPASLASNPCRYVIGDEVDKWPQFTGREASGVDLMEERTRTFVGISKCIIASSPTTKEGVISREYDLTDQREYYIPCPHCGEWQPLLWKNVKWPEGEKDHRRIKARNLAWYECRKCAEHITDQQKLDAMAFGRWVPKDGAIDEDGNVSEPQVAFTARGYHLWAGYSPWLTWSDIAAKFVEAERSGDRAKLMNFVNSWLAECWEETVEKPKSSAILRAVQDYERGQVPADVQVLVAGSDVQKNAVYVSVWGFGFEERAYLVYENRFGADLAALEREVLNAEFQTVDRQRHLRVHTLGIDSRHRREDVLALARENMTRVRALVGTEFNSPESFRVKRMDRNPITGAPFAQSLQLWHTNVGIFKDQVAQAMRLGPGTHRRAFHVHRDPPDDFVAQMAAEHKIKVTSGRRVVERWVPIKRGGANHYFDTAVYSWAVAEMIGVNRMRPIESVEPRPSIRISTEL